MILIIFYNNQSKYSDHFEFSHLIEQCGNDKYNINISILRHQEYFRKNNFYGYLFAAYSDNRQDKLISENDFIEMMKKIETEFSYRPIIISYLSDRLL